MKPYEQETRYWIEKDLDGRGWKENGEGVWNASGEDIVSVCENTPPSPVKVKTLKSIEPGQYGSVTVKYRKTDETVGSTVCVGVCSGDSWCVDLNSEELRSAARTFMQLAEFLEEQGK